MRLIIGSFMQESNSFSGFKITDFQDQSNGGYSEFLVGKEIMTKHQGKRTEIGAFIEIARKKNIDLIPFILANGCPGGIVTKQAYQEIKSLFLEKLKEVKQFDGVLLALHGAMVVEGLDDPEGDFLQAIREQVGKEIPIVSSFDMHANFTKKMMDNLDGLAGYDTWPHVDFYETGERAIRLMISILQKKIKPAIALRRLPLMAAANAQTTHGPMYEIMKKAKDIEQEEKIISTVVFAVQPWLDLPHVGFSIVVVADNDLALAQAKADEIARLIWQRRKQFDLKEMGEIPVEEALIRVKKIDGGPVVLSDSANSPSGGAGADSTQVLRELIESRIEFPATLTITDPEAVKKCIAKGVGETIIVEVGGKIDKDFSKPLIVEGYIKTISDGKYTYKGKIWQGRVENMGKTIVLVIKQNIYLVITELRAITFDPEQFISLGISPQDMKIIVVKSPNTFRANYEPISKEIIMLNSQGPCSPDIIHLPFKKITRPMYPWDEMDEYEV